MPTQCPLLCRWMHSWVSPPPWRQLQGRNIYCCLEDECLKRNPLFKGRTKTEWGTVWPLLEIDKYQDEIKWRRDAFCCYFRESSHLFSQDPSPTARPWCHVLILSERVGSSSDVCCNATMMLFALLLRHWAWCRRWHGAAPTPFLASTWFISLLCCRRLCLLLLTLMSNHTAAPAPSVGLITLGSQASFALSNALLLIPFSVIWISFSQHLCPKMLPSYLVPLGLSLHALTFCYNFGVIGLMFIVFPYCWCWRTPVVWTIALHSGLLCSDGCYKALR